MKTLKFIKAGTLALAIVGFSVSAFAQEVARSFTASKLTSNQLQLRESVAHYFALLGVSCAPNCPGSDVATVRTQLRHLTSILRSASQEDRLFYVLEVVGHFLGKPLMASADQVSEVAPSNIKALVTQRMLRALARHKQIQFVFPYETKNVVINSNNIKNIDDLMADSEIVGTYACQTSLISIDLNRGPADIASIVLHELNHYFIDRKLGMQNSKIADLFSAMLMEEIYSSVYGSLHQRQLAEFSSRKDLLIQLSDEGLDFRLTDLRSKKSTAGVILSNLQGSLSAERSISEEIGRILRERGLLTKLSKRFKKFYFPRVIVPMRLPPENHEDYLAVASLLYQPGLLRLSSHDFEKEIQIQKFSNVRCEQFLNAKSDLSASGYPGVRLGGESGKTGGESGKPGGESGKTEREFVLPCLVHRMVP